MMHDPNEMAPKPLRPAENDFVGDEQGAEAPASDHEQTASISGVAAALPALNLIGRTIGSYHVIELLGEGGMGVVYEAEQQSPHRRVALKVMRRGHDVDEVHARMFHHEADALARLRHPKIAAIYESGHTEDGHDYFAMELVRGQTLNQWLEQRRQPTTRSEVQRRLELFHSICEAVQYAHQRGVVHRDLKPANIMVLESDGSSDSPPAAIPMVKVLDFGLARITDPDMQAATIMSEIGVIRGTLPYMSPEQTKSDVDAVDVRTDVYALGVILYEMLSGERPYDVDSATLLDALRIICEEPPKPLLTRTTGALRLDQDLETIVRKALAKNPDERYGTVLELADDVNRYLTARPIHARPPSAAYRIQRFVQRNKVAVAASGAVVFALFIAMVGIALGLVRARDAEAEARREAATSAKVSRFLVDMLASVDAQQVGRLLLSDIEERVMDSARDRGIDPDRAAADYRQAISEVSGTEVGRRLVDEAILSQAARAVRERFDNEPRVAGQLEHTLAETYLWLGLNDIASEHARRAAVIRSRALGRDSREALQSTALIGLLEYHQGRLDDAERTLRETSRRQEELFGGDHEDTTWTRVRLSWVEIERGRLETAEEILRDALERQRRTLGDEHRDTATTMNSLAVVYADQQRFSEAEALHSKVLEIRSRTLGPTDPDTLKSMTNLAVVSFYQGRLVVAAELFQDVVDLQIESLGPDHPVTLATMNNLAVILERQGRIEEAEEMHRRVLASKRQVLGDEHPETVSSRYNLAIVLTSQGRLDAAEQMHREIFEIRLEELGEQHPRTLDSLCALAGVAALRGDRDTALDRLARAVDLGYLDGDTLMADSDFESLRSDAAFAAIVERARGNAERSEL
jgi:serine/threonine protein kinase/tetratricopeptide (TPR) repeat protein